jgi:hypothetical protein
VVAIKSLLRQGLQARRQIVLFTARHDDHADPGREFGRALASQSLVEMAAPRRVPFVGLGAPRFDRRPIRLRGSVGEPRSTAALSAGKAIAVAGRRTI